MDVRVFAAILFNMFAFWFGGVRNALVLRYRVHVLNTRGVIAWAALPHYFTMMFKFWEWPAGRLFRRDI